MPALPIDEQSSDAALLKAFAETQSEKPLRLLIARYSSLVFHSALRITGCPNLAQEVAATTFAILARKANRLKGGEGIGGWLHRTATYEAAKSARSERRHRRKIKALAQSTDTDNEMTLLDEPAWKEIVPHLDQAIQQLSSQDQNLIIERFYHDRELKEIAQSSGISESAIQKRSQRALRRLAKFLRKRGVAAASTSVLIAGLGLQFSPSAASAASVTTLTQSAIQLAPQLSLSTLLTHTITTMSTIKSATVGGAAVLALALAPLMLQQRTISRNQLELAELRKQLFHQEERSRPLAAVQLSPSDSSEQDPSGRALQEQTIIPSSRLRDLLSGDERPPQPEIDAFIGDNRSLSELEAMYEEASSVRTSERQRGALMKILFEIGKHDGQRAVELVASTIKSPSFRSRAIESAYRGWGTHDPFGAWKYVESLSPEERAIAPLGEIVFGAAMGDLKPQEFYRFVEANYEPLRNYSTARLWGALTHVYNEKDSRGMPGWIQGLPDGGLKHLASRQLVHHWGELDPNAARAWMEEHVDLKANPLAVHSLTTAWAEEDPLSAIDWLTSQPEDLQTPKNYEGLFGHWLRHDPINAAKWLADAEPSPLLDRPFEQYASKIKWTDPSEAMNWASSITEPDRRARAMKDIASTWRSRDPDGFSTYVTENPSDELLRSDKSN